MVAAKAGGLAEDDVAGAGGRYMPALWGADDMSAKPSPLTSPAAATEMAHLVAGDAVDAEAVAAVEVRQFQGGAERRWRHRAVGELEVFNRLRPCRCRRLRRPRPARSNGWLAEARSWWMT